MTFGSRIKISRLADCASQAVGVCPSKWFVAIVGNNTEMSSYKQLIGFGYEAFLPTQEEIVLWKDGRRKKRLRIIIPGIVLIKLTEIQRKEIVTLPFIKRFMIDPARKVDAFNRHPIAIIPNEQIEALKFMLDNCTSELHMESFSIKDGDLVKVIRGKLSGLVGHVKKTPNQRAKVFVVIDYLGCASIEISQKDICKVINQ